MWKFNSLIFPAPESSYTEESWAGNLIYIPRHYNRDEVAFQKVRKGYQFPKGSNGIKSPFFYQNDQRSLGKKTALNESLMYTNIPALYLPNEETRSNKLMIFFHANAEDIGNNIEMLKSIRTTLGVSILAPEYPGYGIYRKVQRISIQSQSLLEVDHSKPEIQCSEEQIKEDADCIYDFVLATFPGLV